MNAKISKRICAAASAITAAIGKTRLRKVKTLFVLSSLSALTTFCPAPPTIINARRLFQTNNAF